jgi:hypothetical protein
MTGHLASKIAIFSDGLGQIACGIVEWVLCWALNHRASSIWDVARGFRYQSRPTAAACVWPALALA